MHSSSGWAMTRVMAAWSMMLSVRRCMGLKAGLLEAVGGKLGPCVALYCYWPSLAAEGDQKRRFFSYYLENGFLHGFFFASVYMLFLKCKAFLAGVKAEVFFASALTFLALDTSAEWSDPQKGFQHRGMIPVLGSRGARRARMHTGGPGFDPRFGPRLFFCPLRIHYPRGGSRAAPESSTSQGTRLPGLQWARETPTGRLRTKRPRRRAPGDGQKIQDPQN